MKTEAFVKSFRHSLAMALLLLGCQQKMADQPHYEPLQKSDFFADQRASRPLVEGTVARGHLGADMEFYTGKTEAGPVKVFPITVDRKVFRRGQERFDIFCAPCHDRVGTGQGMIVRRGYRPPPSFHIDRLREAPPGHFFDVISHGFGSMPDYAAQITPADRWAIVAYIRALQFSQNASVGALPESERAKLSESSK